MGEHLVFLLHAPLGAMGGVAVGEQRTGFDRPGKSAILGLVGQVWGLIGRTRRPIRRSPTAMGWVSARSRLGICSLIITRHRCHRSAGTAASRPGGRNWASMISAHTLCSRIRTDPAYLWSLGARGTALATRSFRRGPEAPTFHALFRAQGVPVGCASRSSRGQADDPHLHFSPISRGGHRNSRNSFAI